jgi:cytochrome c556
MVRTILIGGALVLGVGAAIAQTDVIKQRQELMKANVAAARPTFGMLRGQAPFNLDQVQTALKTFAQSAKQVPTLFPENSNAGETRALPAIWENKTDFDKAAAKLEQDAQAALTAIRDEASFKANYPAVVQNCDACHDKFRKPS